MTDTARGYVFGTILPPVQTEAQGWVVFVFASYLLGHFVFLLGSFLDEPYDLIRKAFIPAQAERAYQRAKALKEACLRDADEPVINSFQWAKARIQLKYPTAAVEVHRLEADQKFFRSLIVVLLVILVYLVYRAASDHDSLIWGQVAVLVLLTGLSFWRYYDQRLKSTTLAYTYLIASELPSRSEGQPT